MIGGLRPPFSFGAALAAPAPTVRGLDLASSNRDSCRAEQSAAGVELESRSLPLVVLILENRCVLGQAISAGVKPYVFETGRAISTPEQYYCALFLLLNIFFFYHIV